ncbi:MAG: heavy-metal-associated domain-containing protein [Planctomycetaceae bacterium]
MKTLSLLAAFVLVASTSPAVAADATVENMHICCGACVKGISKALGKAKGVSDVIVDKEKKSVSFKATDAKTARRGLVALARAGFYGKAKVDGKARRFPARRVKKGTKADTAVLRGLHLCCPLCEKGVKAAMKGVSGIEDITITRKKRTVKLTGKDIDIAAAVAALNKAGFSARYGQRKKPKK